MQLITFAQNNNETGLFEKFKCIKVNLIFAIYKSFLFYLSSFTVIYYKKKYKRYMYLLCIFNSIYSINDRRPNAMRRITQLFSNAFIFAKVNRVNSHH